MPEYENNHFVPRLNLRRYGEKINRYNLKTKEYLPYGNIKNAFSAKNIYPVELEKALATVEGKFADILANKVLVANEEVALTRKEIWHIKKYLALLMFRVPKSINDERSYKDSEQYLEKILGVKAKRISNESPQDYTFRTMKAIIDAVDYDDLLKNPNITYDALKWMTLYKNCYLTIWDSKESREDFFITDIGMTCEHEKTRFAFEKQGFKEELIKSGFIASKMADSTVDKDQKQIYAGLGQLSTLVGANYYMFSISETRMIGMINPWFRLFFDENKINALGGVPDVCPCLLTMDALETNTNEYVNQDKSINGFLDMKYLDDNDKYIYRIKNLSFKDVCIINCMMLDRADEVIGFVDAKKIFKSLNIYNNLVVKLNDYKSLVDLLYSYGYDFNNNDKMKNLALDITKIDFTANEWKYINVMFDFKNKFSGVKI